MGPTSLPALVAALLLAAGSVLLAAWAWDRSGTSRPRRVLIRCTTLALCPLLAATVALVVLNRELNLYTSWGQLIDDRVVPAGDPVRVAAPTRGGSRIVPLTVRGVRSRISLPTYVYLPPGYDTDDTAKMRYPVIMALAGFPGTPQTWLNRVGAQAMLDAEIRSGRMSPTVVVFPTQDVSSLQDSECVDAVGGAKFDTYLSLDVPAAVRHRFRVRRDRDAWGMIGFSTGGFCVANLTMRHPDRFAAAASIAGYFNASTDATTGDLYRGQLRVRQENSPLWRMRHLPPPRVRLYCLAARDDTGTYQAIRGFAAAARPPTIVDTGAIPSGGHSFSTWRLLTPPSLDWLSSNLARPQQT